MAENNNTARAILNGVVGDYLEETKNNLSIDMAFYRGGKPVDLIERLIAEEQPCPRVCILVHGLTDDESTWSYGEQQDDHGDNDDYGQSLQRDFGDIAPFYLRYNTGLHVSTNGRHLNRLLSSFWHSYPCPIEEVIFLCHSMGGLVVRSACLLASTNQCPWVKRVSRIFFLGTPHHGSFWEKAGNVVSNALGIVPRPYMRLAANVADLRSSGIKDLRFGYVTDQDWEGHDPDAFLNNTKKRADLLPWVRHYIITGTVTKNPRHVASFVIGDALVRKASAEGRSHVEEHDLSVPPDHIHEFPGIRHMQLSSDPRVYLQIKHWMEQHCSVQVPPEWEEKDTDTPNAVYDESNMTEIIQHPCLLGKWAKYHGVATLVHAAVDHGVTAVEGVQHELTDEVYTVLSSTITPLAPAIRSVQTVHEACVGSVYRIIRGVNDLIGTGAKLVCDRMDEKGDA